MLRLFPILLLLFMVTACTGKDKPGDELESHYMLGVSYLRSDNPTMALKEFMLAEKLDDDDARVQAGLGQAYFYKHAYDKAEKHYLRALRLDDENPHYQNNLAANYLESGRLDDAIDYFTRAASNLLFARSENAWAGVGTAYMRKKAYPQALEAFNSALAVNKRYSPGYLYRGDVYLELGDTEKAKSDYLQAISLAPEFAQAHFKLGVVQMKQRDTQGAIKSFKRVVDLVPTSDIGVQAENYLKVLH